MNYDQVKIQPASGQTIDRTFDHLSAYGSEHWCAARCGVGYKNWINSVRKRLEGDGFPPRDPIIGLTLKADVDAWLTKRRRVSDAKPVQEGPARTGGVNLARL